MKRHLYINTSEKKRHVTTTNGALGNNKTKNKKYSRGVFLKIRFDICKEKKHDVMHLYDGENISTRTI